MLGSILSWSSIPSGKVDIHLVTYCYGNQDDYPLAAWTTQSDGGFNNPLLKMEIIVILLIIAGGTSLD